MTTITIALTLAFAACGYLGYALGQYRTILWVTKELSNESLRRLGE